MTRNNWAETSTILKHVWFCVNSYQYFRKKQANTDSVSFFQPRPSSVLVGATRNTSKLCVSKAKLDFTGLTLNILLGQKSATMLMLLPTIIYCIRFQP